jgi:hypothetical protein
LELGQIARLPHPAAHRSGDQPRAPPPGAEKGGDMLRRARRKPFSTDPNRRLICKRRAKPYQGHRHPRQASYIYTEPIPDAIGDRRSRPSRSRWGVSTIVPLQSLGDGEIVDRFDPQEVLRLSDPPAGSASWVNLGPVGSSLRVPDRPLTIIHQELMSSDLGQLGNWVNPREDRKKGSIQCLVCPPAGGLEPKSCWPWRLS